jgi:hypothetical protein
VGKLYVVQGTVYSAGANVRSGYAVCNSGDTALSGSCTATGTTDTTGFQLQEFGVTAGGFMCRWAIYNPNAYTYAFQTSVLCVDVTP